MKRMKTLLTMTTLMIIGTISEVEARGASAVRIAFPVPGVDGRVVAHVEPNGDVTIDEYPETFRGTLKILQMASPVFGRTLSDAACQAVTARAELAADDSYPADLRRIAADNVRHDNSFTLEAAVVSFFGTPELTAAARAAAVAAGVNASSYQIVNPLAGERFAVSLDVAADATSRKIGDLETLTRQLSALLQTSAGLATGKSQGEIAAADLVCDLRAGNVTLNVDVTGTVARVPGIEPLFDVETGRRFYHAMKAELADLSESLTAAQKLVAGGVAVVQAAATANAELDEQKIAVVAAKLFDPRTGILEEVADGQIQEVLSAPRPGGERFEAQGTLVLNP